MVNLNDPLSIFSHYLSLILSLTSCFITVVIIFHIGRSRKIREQFSSKLLFSLLLCDMITAVGTVIYSSMRLAHEHNLLSKYRTHRYVQPALLLMTSSMLHAATSTVMISVDRLLAIKCPFFYCELKSKTVHFVLCLDWLLYGAMFLVWILLWTLDKSVRYKLIFYTSSVLIIVSVNLLLIINTAIFLTARKQFCAIQSTINTITQMSSKDVKKRHETQQAKAARICYGVVITLLVCYTPLIIQTIMKLAEYKKANDRLIDIFVDLGLVTNTIVDPIMYVLINKNIRQQIVRYFFKRKENTRESEIVETTSKN